MTSPATQQSHEKRNSPNTHAGRAARPKRVVILGGGFGGAYTARGLEKELRGQDAEIILLDRHNYLLFYPLLIEAGTGSLEPRHTVVPIREFLRETTFHMAEVRRVDFANRSVEYCIAEGEAPTRIEYDHVVIALGSVTNLPPEDKVPGARTHCYQIKNLTDAVALRDRGIVLLEMADACDDEAKRREMLHIVIVGGSFTGVELAGEYEAFLQGAAKRYRNLKPCDIKITLVEMLDRVLGALGEDLGDIAAEHLRKRGLDLRLGLTVNRVEPDHVILSDETRLATRTVIWCAGIAPNPIVKSLDLPLDERGYIKTQRDLRVEGYENVWGIGDLAVNLNDDGNLQPATAQHATRQGAQVAKNIARALRGEPCQPCHIESQGMLAAIGCRTAVGKVFGFRVSGFIAWWMWRTVYLLKMPRLGRKVRVALDWTISLCFERDYVQLGVHRKKNTTSQGDTT